MFDPQVKDCDDGASPKSGASTFDGAHSKLENDPIWILLLLLRTGLRGCSPN
jgi:hypothetical protein